MISPDTINIYFFRGGHMGKPSSPKASPIGKATGLRSHRVRLAKSQGGQPGDPNAAMPGDRPEAYAAELSEVEFHGRYGGDAEDLLESITCDDGTQLYGKLVPGHRPADGYTLDADGMVVEIKK